ncbi:hypothetical protein Hanom_Chr12g01134271 [Helianthus anomalus]
MMIGKFENFEHGERECDGGGSAAGCWRRWGTLAVVRRRFAGDDGSAAGLR